MDKKDKLHELIQSLGMSEKRYFKLYANRHIIGEKNNYLVLFDILERMPHYRVGEVITQLNAKGQSARHLSSDKNYLYHMILKGLSAFYAGKTASLQVKELLHQVEILYEKNLYDHCLSLLNKAKNQALKYELYPLTIEVSLWERKVMAKLGDIKGVKNALDEAMWYMALLDNMNAFMKLNYEAMDLRNKIAKTRTPEALNRLDAFIQHPFLQNEDIPLTFQARLDYWRIYAMYYYSIGDREQELAANEQVLQLMETRPDYAEEYPAEYIAIYARLLILNQYQPEEAFRGILDEFRSFPNRLKSSRKSIQRSIRIRIEVDSCSIEMSRLLDQGQAAACRQMRVQMQALAQKYALHMSPAQKMTYHYMFAYVHLAEGEYKQALKEVNHILNEYEETVRPDLHLYTRMLNMTVHTGLNNLTVLKYEADSTARFLRKRGKMYRSEATLIRFFRRISRNSNLNPEGRKKIMERFYEELLEIYQGGGESKVLIYFDFLAWLTSRIQEIPFWEAKIQPIRIREVPAEP